MTPDALAGGGAAMLTLALCIWSRLGAGMLARSQAGALYRARGAAAAPAFAGLLALALAAAAWPLAPWGAGLAAAALCVLAAARDPARRGFWHHRRLRLLGVFALAATGAAAGAWSGTAAVPAALGAAFVFHRLQAEAARLAAEAWHEVAAQRERNVALEAAAHQERVARAATHSTVDKLPKAG